MRSRGFWLAAAAALALAGCANGPHSDGTRVTLTEHQRDSVIARSSLPGAPVVGRALAESERQALRASSLDSLTH